MEKIKILPYYQKFPKIFNKEKERISKVIGDTDIHHIGSTAISGLGGKGIIDIMIGVKNWKKAEDIVKKLKKIGFGHIHLKEKGKIFLSKHQKPTPDNVHIHIVLKNSKRYKNFLLFRNYLRKNKKESKKFFELKLEWIKKGEEDRKKYFKFKENYIKEVLNKAK